MRSHAGGSPTAEVRTRVQAAFTHYDADGSGTLDATELREALADLGYCPRSQEEKQQFADLLHRTDESADGELDPAEFEHLVAEVMRILHEGLHAELEEQFRLHELDNSGLVAFQDLQPILEEMALGPRTAAERRLVEAALPKVEESGSGEVGFSEFERFLAQVREGIGRLRRERLRKIVGDCGLSRATVQAVSHQLCELKDRFDEVDEEGRGHIGHQALHVLLADCGVRPLNREDQERMEQLCTGIDADGTGRVSFTGFLNLIQRLRQLAMDRRRPGVRQLFVQADCDGCGKLSLAECSRLLGQFSLNPRTRAQQRRIATLLDVADEDGTGQLSFTEFCILFQHVHEMLQGTLRKQEHEMARSLGMTMAQVEEYRTAFDTFDENDSGKLRVEDVRRLVDILRVQVSGDLLNELVVEVDSICSGAIEFREFLELMSLIELRNAALGPKGLISPSALQNQAQHDGARFFDGVKAGK